MTEEEAKREEASYKRSFPVDCWEELKKEAQEQGFDYVFQWIEFLSAERQWLTPPDDF